MALGRARPATRSRSRPSISGLSAGHLRRPTSAIDSNGGTTTIPVTLTLAAPPPPTPPGLVAAFGFEEGSGTTVVDATGSGNGGTITGATRTTSGRFGSALTFDGINDWVTVSDTDALDLTTGVTMSAWVNPAAVGTIYRTVLMKETARRADLHAVRGRWSRASRAATSTPRASSGPPAPRTRRWTRGRISHRRGTATTLRLFVNGVEAGQPRPGRALRTSTGVLRIGGNAIWSEWFRGAIDEVRVYNRALTLPEIQGDMGRPVPAAGAP